MTRYTHKACNGSISPHPSNDIAFCCHCGKWVESFDEVTLIWDIIKSSSNDAATVNG